MLRLLRLITKIMVNCGVICFLPFLAFASSETTNISDEKISYIPRAYLSGYVGTEFLGEGDLLIPLYVKEDKALIVYGQGRYVPESGDDSWSGGGGLLYRWVVPNINSVLGLYVLGDYNQITSDQEYWDINPGIEALGGLWDFHLNGYIPVGAKCWEKEDWAHNFGNRTYVRAEGFAAYDHKLMEYIETGLGGDVEVGRKLFKIKDMVVKGYAQGYYFNMEHNSDVVGGGLKIKVDTTEQISITANYTYDNYQHSVFMAGVQVKLNGLFNKSKNKVSENIAHRLFDRIDRSYADISTGNRTIVTKGYKDLGESRYIGPSIIDPTNPIFERGTFEKPYTSEDIQKFGGLQAVLDEIHREVKNVMIHFAPGVYNCDSINLPSGISISGKTEDANSVLFIGAITLAGGNNELNNINLQNVDLVNTGREPLKVGIEIRETDNVILNNIVIGAEKKKGNYETSIIINNSSGELNNSTIYGRISFEGNENKLFSMSGIKLINFDDESGIEG